MSEAPAQPVDTGTAGHKPGRVKSAAVGAAGGSVGGPAGAAAGAVTGLLSGGKGKSGGGGNKALVAEFSICMSMLVLKPIVHQGADLTVAKWMKKASATAAVFIILGFLSATGEVPKKVASGLGLLMTLTILLNESSVFGTLVKAVSGKDVSIPKPAPLTSSGPGVNSTEVLTPRVGGLLAGSPGSGPPLGPLTGPVSGVVSDILGPGGDTVIIPYEGHPVGSRSTDPNIPGYLAPSDSVLSKIYHGIFG